LKKYLIVTLLYVLVSTVSYAQDSLFARKMIDTLTSSYFWGRGYTKDGMNKAAQFLASQFKSFGLQPLYSNSYLQPFSYPVNTFPGKMQATINGKELVAGKDFIVSPDSKGVKGKGALVQKDSADFIDVEDRIIVTLKDKLTWSVAPAVADFTIIEVAKKAIEGTPQTVEATIENKLVKNFQTANVCGLVKGTTHPDSIIVLTAHYDHLGGMGKDTYFPGANDNASGTSLLLSLAKFYAENPQPYSIAFICFAGEEAGLLGSKYFASNPLINLSNIRFLINFDLVGTGDEGITVVNATEFAKEFALLNAINDSSKYLAKINARGKAANSDHYWFTEKGVPSFFIYTLGGIKAYHDVFDKSATLPLNEYNDLFKLILQFNKRLMNL
jgi:aminopeptidase YwaD